MRLDVFKVSEALASEVKGDINTVIQDLPGIFRHDALLKVVVVDSTQFVQIPVSHLSFNRFFRNLLVLLFRLLFQLFNLRNHFNPTVMVLFLRAATPFAKSRVEFILVFFLLKIACV